jgi:thiol-disulfide isomerase/thioredoxin
MYLKSVALITLFLFASILLSAQEVTGIHADIRNMSKETDPSKSIMIRDQIIKDYNLNSLEDAETIDLLNGTVGIAFVRKKNYEGFEKYIDLIQNKFNQTSMLNMAANELLDLDIDPAYASKLAKRTLDVYHTFKDDPKAKPENFSQEDWKRFMNFAKYPYYDTYAKALFALKEYEEAIQYQRMAFDGKPEEGLPASVERYAKLLEFSHEKDSAKQLLLKLAGKGKLTKSMIAQLESYYIADSGSSDNFDGYLDSLQHGVRAEMMAKLKKEILNETAPLFSLNDTQGKLTHLSDFRGKIVVLDLWATWCAPCIASFPAMQKLVEKHPDVVFLFIAVDEKGNDAAKRVKNFIDKRKYTFRVLMDELIDGTADKYVITSTYKPNGIPAKYFIDKEGKLRFTSKGFSTDAELVNEVDAMISILKDL